MKKTNNLIYLFMAQTFETEYDYLSDFEKIIKSMKQDSNANKNGFSDSQKMLDSLDINATIEDNSSTSSSAVGKMAKIKEPMSVRELPTTDSSKIGSIYKGSEYLIEGYTKGWYQINYNGTPG